MGLLSNKVRLLGCDVFVVHQGGLPKVPEVVGSLKLQLISNRGTKVWPGPTPEIHLTDVHRCRYVSSSGTQAGIAHNEVIAALQDIEKAGFEWVHVEKLLEIEGVPGFAKAQGE